MTARKEFWLDPDVWEGRPFPWKRLGDNRIGFETPKGFVTVRVRPRTEMRGWEETQPHPYEAAAHWSSVSTSGEQGPIKSAYTTLPVAMARAEMWAVVAGWSELWMLAQAGLETTPLEED